ncbi:dTDP-6-deoxy-3,4-keto-hexulose isomerase [Verrucomicrobiota bacterium]|nr:TDP-4-oxo-6-deoxy-alpha-D-glucose-3,4-oxoisomerase [Verrucomicrobiota bacterium]GDY17036.1 dTDP-6-deoxy-3,4-keto-hexulose isomerase [Verrucomicrobiota bacterium]
MSPPALAQSVVIPQRGDARGQLAIVELGQTLPFPVRRVYWIHDATPQSERGYHAHRQLRQLLVCVAGSVELELTDGKSKETLRLDAFSQGVVLGSGVWRVLRNFSPDCILVVLTDREYNEADYIRDYAEFLQAFPHA